jgi:hypothetical protein
MNANLKHCFVNLLCCAKGHKYYWHFCSSRKREYLSTHNARPMCVSVRLERGIPSGEYTSPVKKEEKIGMIVSQKVRTTTQI